MNNLGLTQLSYTWEYTKHNKSETITQIYSNVIKKKKKKKKILRTDICLVWLQKQAFIQTILLMSVFLGKIEFSNVLKCRWGSQGAASSATDSWQNPDGGSWGKTPEKFWSFYIWRANKYPKIEETMQANLF